jgi:hypothetical protein
MEHLQKSWLLPLSGQKKFTASTLSYSLSKLLNRKDFEVVNESYVDIHDLNSEQPDVIIYNRNNDYKPAMMIELTNHSSLESTLHTIEIIAKIHHVPEAFVLDFDKQKWFRIADSVVTSSAASKVFGLDLQQILSNSLMRYS